MIIRSETLTKYQRHFRRAMHDFEILNFLPNKLRTHMKQRIVSKDKIERKRTIENTSRVSTFYYPEIRGSYLRFTRARKPQITDTKQESIPPGHSRSHKETKSSNFPVKRQEQLLGICLPAIHDEDRKKPTYLPLRPARAVLPTL